MMATGFSFILNYFIVDAMNIILNRLIMAGLSEGLRREPSGEDVRKSHQKKMPSSNITSMINYYYYFLIS